MKFISTKKYTYSTEWNILNVKLLKLVTTEFTHDKIHLNKWPKTSNLYSSANLYLFLQPFKNSGQRTFQLTQKSLETNQQNVLAASVANRNHTYQKLFQLNVFGVSFSKREIYKTKTAISSSLCFWVLFMEIMQSFVLSSAFT